MAQDASQDEQVRVDVCDIHRLQLAVHPDRDAFASKLVDHVQHSIFPAFLCAILDELVGQEMVGVLWPPTDACAVVEPKTPVLGLSGGNLQPLASPDQFDSFDIHHPALIAQHRRNAAVAIAALLDGKRRDVGGQGRLVIGFHRDLPLRRAVLAEKPASEPYGDAMFGDHMPHAGAAPRGVCK